MGESLANDLFQLQQSALEVHSARIAAAQPGSKQFVVGRSVSDKFPKGLLASAQVAVLVPLSVVIPLVRVGLPRGNHRFSTLGFDAVDQRLAVVAFVANHDFKGHTIQKRLRLIHVGRLTARQHDGDRQTKSVDRCVDLGAESASAAAQRFGCRTAVFLGAPAACWCARITVESKMSHSRSGSCKASKTRCQTPLRDQRSNRLPDRVPFAKALGKIAPRCSRLGDPKYCIDKQTIVLGRDAWIARFARKPILDSLPLFVRDRVAVAHDQALLGQMVGLKRP